MLYCRFIKLKWLKLLEAGLVAAIAGGASIVMFMNMYSCTDKMPYDKEAIVAQVRFNFKKIIITFMIV